MHAVHALGLKPPSAMAHAMKSIESAILHGNVHELRAILFNLPKCFDINATSSLNDQNIVKHLSPLNLAIFTHQDIEVSRLLLQHCADPNMKTLEGGTSLHLAAKTGQLDIVEMLLSRCDVEAFDGLGRTALHIAVQNNKHKVVELLLLHCENVNAEDAEGNTALHLSLRWRSKTSLYLLLSHGAKVELRNMKQENALQIAVMSRDDPIEAIDMLVKHGANIHARDASGRSVLDSMFASSDSIRTDVIVHLLSAGVEFDYKGNRASIRDRLKNRDVQGLRYLIDRMETSCRTQHNDFLCQVAVLFERDPVLRYEIVRFFLQDDESVDPFKQHPLLKYATDLKDLKLLELLIEFRVHERSKDYGQSTSLYLSSR